MTKYSDNMHHKVLKHISFFLLCLISSGLSSQDTNRKIEFPDVNGFLTLKTDLHIHTVFSDGQVWPNIRIEEAVRDGLDAISLTEHIEYQPWKDDIPNPDRNRSYHLALEAAKPYDLLIIPGTEITRKMPPGHANALFVSDVNKIINDDYIESYREARKQGAFIFWNHPNWINQQKDAIPTITEIHKKLIAEDLLHGIEVVNDLTFSEIGMQVAKDHNLTIIGTSDIHGLVDYQYEILEGGHRPISLVFSKERTVEGIKEALFAGRTITWFNNILAGTPENMKLLMDASLSTKMLGFIADSEVLEIQLENKSDAALLLMNTSSYDFYAHAGTIEIPAHSTKKIQIITSHNKGLEAHLTFQVLNAVIGYKQTYILDINLQQ